MNIQINPEADVHGAVLDDLRFGPEISRALNAQLDGILSRYDQRLVAEGVGADDPAMRRFCAAQAGAVLDDVIHALRSGQSLRGLRALDADRGAFAGSSPCPARPEEARAAVTALFDTVMEAFARLAQPHPDAVQRLTAGAICLHHSIMARFQAALESQTRKMLHETAHSFLEERRSISRDLHDRAGYAVSVAKQNVELAQMYRSLGDAAADPKLATAHASVREALEEIRLLASALRPYARSEGLEPALRRCARQLCPPEADFDLVLTGHEAWLSGEAADELFLALREAMRNAFAHSRARKVTVRIDIAPHQTRAAVEDDGVGFEGATGDEFDGVGLVAMRERIERLGGSVAVSSHLGRGVFVELLLPRERG
ncbi:sensor histidine kinase [Streptomyces sp. NPDC048172]|uniref:sensor histidine kinase n=1 Tax=Streptomyces sp. NPDC048172 TaxID=3365505 RepID=UPI0037193489